MQKRRRDTKHDCGGLRRGKARQQVRERSEGQQVAGKSGRDLARRSGAPERAIEDYRSRHNLFQNDGSTLIARQMSDLNIKLIDARMERIAAEANFGEARRLLNSRSPLGRPRFRCCSRT